MQVELRPAFEWTCETCGRNQYESGIVAEMSPEDRIRLAASMGIGPEDIADCSEQLSGEFMLMPEQVICEACGSEFTTRHYSEQE